ncbi:MAG: hypothetical protein AAF526_10960 [Pseudomonadota bacterium]
MEFRRTDVTVRSETMEHARGAWAGMRPQWYVATHNPTGVSVVWHGVSDLSQHRAYEAGMACLELLIEGTGCQRLPEYEGNHKSERKE